MAAIVEAHFDAMVALGACAADLVKQAGFDPRSIADPDARIPIEQSARLWRVGHSLIGDPTLALRIGELADPRRMGIVGSVALSSATLRDTGRQFARYARLINGGVEIIEREASGFYTCTYRPKHPLQFTPQVVELYCATAITLCRIFTQVDIVPTEMRFHYAQPSYVAEYERIFRCPLRFNQPDSAMMFDVRYQDLRLPNHDAYAHTVLSRHACSLLDALDHVVTVTDKVKRHVLANMNSGALNSAQCAASLGMSRRTLHRRLCEEGATFLSLLDKIRCQLAVEYLIRRELSTGEIAFLLGYSETSAFHRAFKRWSGKSPAAYREENRDSASPSCPVVKEPG